MFSKFIERPVLAIAVSLAIIFLGILAINTRPVSQFPDIAPPRVNIFIAYPGSSADVLVNPSVMENSPLTVIEALSCGTPAVVFAVGGAGELIAEASGAVIAQRSAAALAETLNDVLFQRSFDRSAIRACAAAHEPQAVLQQFAQLYRELVAS